MVSANERRRYYVTHSLIGRDHTRNDPCYQDQSALEKANWYLHVYAYLEIRLIKYTLHENDYIMLYMYRV